MSLTFTILGCGSSMGVPRVALGWGLCDPNNPKNRRRRCSLLVERTNGQGQRTRVLVDCSPDLRTQLLDSEVDWLDGVVITHEHADHTHGIDDLRPLFVNKRRRVDVYLDEHTSEAMRARFGYCFATPSGSEYPLSQMRNVLRLVNRLRSTGRVARLTRYRSCRTTGISRPSGFASAMSPIPPTSKACPAKA